MVIFAVEKQVILLDIPKKGLYLCGVIDATLTQEKTYFSSKVSNGTFVTFGLQKGALVMVAYMTRA